MTRKRFWTLLGLMAWVLGIILQATPAAADKPTGYCTEDGTPVVTFWPPGWNEEDWEASCYYGRLDFTDRRPIPDDGALWSLETVKEQPDDFGRWVHLILNDYFLVNPYHDVDPYIAEGSGRTLVPLRYVSEAFGAKVDWNSDTRMVVMSWKNRQIQLTIGEHTALVDGQQVTLDQPALIWKDRTIVPLRFVSETFGAEVMWYPNTSVVVIKLPDVQCPPAYCEQ